MMTTTTSLTLLMAALALLFSFCTVLFSILAYCNVVGLKNSTHKVQYMPFDEFNNLKGESVDEEDQEEEEKEIPLGMPMTGPEKKEKKRIEKLGENFGQMYKDEL